LSLEQAFPQVPQLALSVAGVMQVAPHRRVPVAQVGPPVPAAPPEVPAVPLPEVPAEPLEVPAAPPLPELIPAPPLPPPAPLDVPDENDPHESTTAPRNTTTDTGTRERMVFIETSPVR
jgi:hypothetical protein